MCAEIHDIITCRKCKQAIIKYGKVSCGSVNNECLELFRKFGYSAAKDCTEFMKIKIGESKELTLDRALKFMLAGQSEFKVVSGKTGKEYYYKLMKRKATGGYDEFSNDYIYWISGGETEDNLKYLGSIYLNKAKNEFEFSKGINGNEDNKSNIVVSILFILNRLYYGKYKTNIKVVHNGTCGRCSRQLTDVQSILTGICKDCSRKVDTPYNIMIHKN